LNFDINVTALAKTENINRETETEIAEDRKLTLLLKVTSLHQADPQHSGDMVECPFPPTSPDARPLALDVRP
jgi:hypothetical protein